MLWGKVANGRCNGQSNASMSKLFLLRRVPHKRDRAYVDVRIYLAKYLTFRNDDVTYPVLSKKYLCAYTYLAKYIFVFYPISY